MEACRAASALNYSQALGFLTVILLTEAIWLYWAGRGLPAGRARVAAAVVAVLTNLALPRLFCRHEEPISIVLTAFNTGWLTNFKILAWLLNRGTLCERPYSLPQFAALLLAPLTPQSTAAAAGPGRGSRRAADSAGSPQEMLLAWLGKLAFISCDVYLLQCDMPKPLRAFLMSLGLYALLCSIMDGPGAFFSSLIGIQVSPHFDQPWLSNSISSFWSQRWDLAAGNALRALVYEPVCEGKWVHSAKDRPAPNRPSALRVAAGALLTFLASGLVHEYIFWCITGHTTGGVWAAFFLLQVPLQLGERLLLGWLKRRGIMLPNLLRIAVTVSVECCLGWYLFWRPVDEEGITDEVTRSVKAALHSFYR